MSDYARNYDFTAKDALTTGNPNKLIKGSEIDDEFNDVLTAVNSKVDDPAGPTEGDVLQWQSGAWVAAGSAIAPTGAVIPYAGSTAPTKWLLCDGASVSTTTYAALFAITGYTYGGSGPNFNLPDLRGRAVFGKDDMGGNDAARVTSGSAAGVDGDTLGASGGVEEHALTIAELAAHDHDRNTSGQGERPLRGSGAEGHGGGAFTSSPAETKTGSTGDGDAHTNMPPTLILNYIIRT